MIIQIIFAKKIYYLVNKYILKKIKMFNLNLIKNYNRKINLLETNSILGREQTIQLTIGSRTNQPTNQVSIH